MRGDEAKEKCPEIVLAVVPSLRGKADTSKYAKYKRRLKTEKQTNKKRNVNFEYK